MMNEHPNPLLCDIETGVCEMPGISSDTIGASSIEATQKPLKVIYFTDPICSSCWGIEPQLRKLKLAYKTTIEIEYRMGGLLPDWRYNSGGISKPSDVAHHWDEVSRHYDMPIDGDVWLEDPLSSSFPPSIAFKAAQLQDRLNAISFLRALREMVFLEKKNICKWEHLEMAAQIAGLDVALFKSDYEGRANALFEEDLALAKAFGVRGFPSIFLINNEGQKEFVYGTKPYKVYETALQKVAPYAIKESYGKTWQELFVSFNTLTAKEFTELSGNSRLESEHILDDLTTKGLLDKHSTKNGSIWRRKFN